jgi:hypothetical protein
MIWLVTHFGAPSIHRPALLMILFAADWSFLIWGALQASMPYSRVADTQHCAICAWTFGLRFGILLNKDWIAKDAFLAFATLFLRCGSDDDMDLTNPR